MDWLIFVALVITYIALGDIVAGIIDANEIGENIWCTIMWPIIVLVLIFGYSYMWLRKLGRKIGKWIGVKK